MSCNFTYAWVDFFRKGQRQHASPMEPKLDFCSMVFWIESLKLSIISKGRILKINHPCTTGSRIVT